MRWLSKLMLFVSVGAFTVVLAGCYGSMSMMRNHGLFQRPTTFADDAPITGVQTAPPQQQLTPLPEAKPKDKKDSETSK